MGLVAEFGVNEGVAEDDELMLSELIRLRLRYLRRFGGLDTDRGET